jgi:hypothetical protein
MAENDWNQVTAVLNRRMVKVVQLERNKLVGLSAGEDCAVVRNCLL